MASIQQKLNYLANGLDVPEHKLGEETDQIDPNSHVGLTIHSIINQAAILGSQLDSVARPDFFSSIVTQVEVIIYG